MNNEPHSNPNDIDLEGLISREMAGMGTHLHVKVKDDVVTLSGIAEDFEEKRRIDSVVKEVTGKHKVVNQIRVISTEDSFDNNR